MRFVLGLAPAVLALACSSPAGGAGAAAPASADPAAGAFIADLAAQVAAAEKAQATVVDGRDGWMFFVPELRSLAAGRFWGEAAARVGRAADVAARDPLPAILDFQKQLEGAGIDLLFVPVPAKATLYPEAISSAVKVGPDGVPPRLDRAQQEFLAVLEKSGVKTLDLVPAFLAHRQEAKGALYCRQDTHWSSLGAALAAREIAARVGSPAWLKEAARRPLASAESTIEISGDLWAQHADPKPARERLTLLTVGEQTDAGVRPLAAARDSPILLLADSHGLVFHGGADMHAEGAGLADHLALAWGIPVDLVAVRGSGATPARVNLLRRGDNLKGKKLVIWCLSVRELTEGQGWKKVPVIRDGK